MKYHSMLSFAASTLLGGAFLLGQGAPADSFKSVQTKVQAKQFAEAVAEAEQVLATPNLPPAEKARFLKLAAETVMRISRTEAPKAIAYHERIVADAAILVSAKVEAINNIANLQILELSGKDLYEMDLSAAHATLQRALKLPDLKPDDRANALRNIGKLHDRADQFAAARETYQKVLALDVNDRAKADVQRLIADSLAKEGKVDEAVAMYRKHNFDLIALYQQVGDREKQQAEAEKILNDAAAPDPLRWTTFTRLPCWDHRVKDLAAIRQACEKYLPAFLEKDPTRAAFIKTRAFDNAVGKDHVLVEWAAPLLLANPKITDKEYTVVKMAYVDALAAQGKTAPAVEAATALITDERVSAPTRLWARLVSAALSPNGGTASLTGVVADAKDLPNSEKAEAILAAAKTALRAGNEPSARALNEAYETLLGRRARAAITCRFVPDAPYDIGSWLASPILKSAESSAKLDRPYGDNLQFLIATDSAITGRQAGGPSKEPTGDTETDFHVACDADGVHLFLNARDARVADVVAGLVGGGGYEICLAPGAHQAYYTFLADLPKGTIDPGGFLTMYPNAGFRLPSFADGSIRTATQATDSGFATNIFLAWELFYDRLPVDGRKWEFESIRWTRSGGFSFGGSESVHNRSSFGDIVFANLTAENLNAIKRGIVFKAVAKYQKARGTRGPIAVWTDPVLGDPAFYQAKVEPLLKTLDAHAEKTKKPLTAEDVEKLFAEAVPGWMELEYHVAALRGEYLQEKQLTVK